MSGGAGGGGAAAQVTVHLLWRTGGGAALTPEAVERLAPYVTRYAHTLGLRVLAVGGATDHLHILYDLAPDKTLRYVSDELQKTTTRFLRDVLAVRGFAWSEDTRMDSVGPDAVEHLSGYVRENAARHQAGRLLPEWEGDAAPDGESDDEMPGWLREVLPGS